MAVQDTKKFKEWESATEELSKREAWYRNTKTLPKIIPGVHTVRRSSRRHAELTRRFSANCNGRPPRCCYAEFQAKSALSLPPANSANRSRTSAKLFADRARAHSAGDSLGNRPSLFVS
jgi:hypothetical protein